MNAEERYAKSTGIIGFTLGRFFPGSKNDEDVNAEAEKALWMACLKYDETKGSKFSPFAVNYIKGYVRRYLESDNRYRENVRKDLTLSDLHIAGSKDVDISGIEYDDYIMSIPEEGGMRDAAIQALHPEMKILSDAEFEESKGKLKSYLEKLKQQNK